MDQIIEYPYMGSISISKSYSEWSPQNPHVSPVEQILHTLNPQFSDAFPDCISPHRFRVFPCSANFQHFMIFFRCRFSEPPPWFRQKPTKTIKPTHLRPAAIRKVGANQLHQGRDLKKVIGQNGKIGEGGSPVFRPSQAALVPNFLNVHPSWCPLGLNSRENGNSWRCSWNINDMAAEATKKMGISLAKMANSEIGTYDTVQTGVWTCSQTTASSAKVELKPLGLCMLEEPCPIVWIGWCQIFVKDSCQLFQGWYLSIKIVSKICQNPAADDFLSCLVHPKPQFWS